MGYPILDLDVARPFPTVPLDADADGVAVLLRRRTRPVAFWIEPLPPCPAPGGAKRVLTPDDLGGQAVRHARHALVRTGLREELRGRGGGAPFPSLTVAVCTRDRPDALARCIRSVAAVERPEGASKVEVLVVDNAPPDGRTREAVAAAPGVRYVCEPRAGLNFARNRALHEASGAWVAFLDDDVVADRWWLAGLAEALGDHPDAAAVTGLVLPYALETPAQVLFEERGGFRSAFEAGFETVRYGPRRAGDPRYPVEAGLFGAGANMAFRRDVLVGLGGFDEALDTGAPLPGGGDLDAFYRVVRAGHPLVYEPSCLVFHEHRRDLASLGRQYRSWGLGFMAFVAKSYADDPAYRPVHRQAVRAWFRRQARQVAGAVRARDRQRVAFLAAELRGGVVGLLGEYARSGRRVRRIREGHP